VVDEAFLGFTDQQSVAGTEGVVVARSLTKLFGLPGLRSGFAVATGRLREALRRARRPWNLSAPALATAEFCLQQTAFIDDTRERVRRERTRMADRLTERFRLHDSGAPFLLIDVGERDVGAVVSRVRKRGIAVRDATTFRGLDSHVRVAVRLQAENTRLMEALESV
jgi:L-threonine O-3-phosphate decarboxylase (EC 4.1.1.81)